jgi:hypothetical protein
MKRKDILLILIPSFIFVLAWIGFSIYHNIVTSTISEPLSVQITPITPNFDTSVIDNLKNREKVSPIYQLSVPVEKPVTSASSSATNQIIITPTPGVTEVGQSTPEGSLIR